MSEHNTINRDKVTMVHTTSSVPVAKYIKDEVLTFEFKVYHFFSIQTTLNLCVYDILARTE